jgi:hypothetical protein
MAITATTTATKKELIPAGNYIARCYQMIQIGHVREMILGEIKTLNKVRIGWELPTETKVFNVEKGEQPFVISEEYTLSMHEKSNLRKMLASWRGKEFSQEEAAGFDITKLLGVPCMLNIIHKPAKSDPSIIYQKIGSVSPLAKGVSCPPQSNPISVLQYDKFNFEFFNSLPDFLKDKIKQSEEFMKLSNPEQAVFMGDDEANSDLPF